VVLYECDFRGAIETAFVSNLRVSDLEGLIRLGSAPAPLIQQEDPLGSARFARLLLGGGREPLLGAHFVCRWKQGSSTQRE
jgi:hypothetical protein